MELLNDPIFWLAVGQIILIDILLGGDNAIVIAMACRGLPEHQRRRGILLGTAGAIIIRVALIGVALTLLGIPYLKLVGAVLLMWIGIKLLTDESEDHEISASDTNTSVIAAPMTKFGERSAARSDASEAGTELLERQPDLRRRACPRSVCSSSVRPGKWSPYRSACNWAQPQTT
jgi:predicted tellurium resistance membrane protein TerC